MNDKTELEYKCGWCDRVFKKFVGTSGGGKHQTVSSQVQCVCGNFLKTWRGV
mgnify:CR=1 FL=1